MPQHKEVYHESYHQHSCGILGSKDVIDLDIPGRNILCIFWRWWEDLFLVSGLDERSRVLFSSSHSLRMERMRQFRKFRWKIHPFSKFRNFWDWLMLHVFTLLCVCIHINTSIIYGDITIYTYFLGALLDMFILTDVLVNVLTAYVDDEKRRVEFYTQRVLVHYCSTKLLFHVASAIPLEWIMFLRYGKSINCSLCKCNTFVTVAKFRVVLIVARTYEYSLYWTRPRNSARLMHIFKFFRIGILSSITLLVFRDLCDTIHLHMMIFKNNLDYQTRPVLIIIAKHGLDDPVSHFTLISHEIFRICASLYLFTFLVPADSYYDNLTITLICYVVANMFFMWVTLEFYSFVYRRKFQGDSLLIAKRMAYNMIKCNQLSYHTKQKVDEYFDYNMAAMKVFDVTNFLYKSFPKVLRNAELKSRYTHYVERVEYFNEWPSHIIQKLVLLLREEVFIRNSLVAEPWVESEGLHIVVHGELAVYTDDVETGHMIDGDYFGELSLVTDSEVRISTVVAVTPCLVLVLNKTRFRRLMRKDPELFFEMKKKLKDKYFLKITKPDLTPDKI